jgi:hypothetical protein
VVVQVQQMVPIQFFLQLHLQAAALAAQLVVLETARLEVRAVVLAR